MPQANRGVARRNCNVHTRRAIGGHRERDPLARRDFEWQPNLGTETSARLAPVGDREALGVQLELEILRIGLLQVRDAETHAIVIVLGERVADPDHRREKSRVNALSAADRVATWRTIEAIQQREVVFY